MDYLDSIARVIYETPELTGLDEQVLGEIQELRDDLRFHLVSPRRWYGTLSRVMMARAVQASTSIEGYHSTVDETAAIIDGEKPPGVDDDTRKRHFRLPQRHDLRPAAHRPVEP